MLKTALTFWFAVATLIGPGVCCCSLAAAKPAPSAPQSPPPAKPKKACCSTPPATPDSPAHKPAGESPNCPCKDAKKLTAPAPAGPSDGSGHAKFVGWGDSAVVSHSVPAAVVELRPSVPPHPSPLGGRALLAAYHVLRC